MATELTRDAVQAFIQQNGGKVKNQVLVTYFRKFINDPDKKGWSLSQTKYLCFCVTILLAIFILNWKIDQVISSKGVPDYFG